MLVDNSFGQVVKTHRRELGLTQEELARRVGCAPVTLRKIEYDDLRPSVQIAERLAMALNIPLDERAAFVRLARMERIQFVEPPPTPPPTLEEIGAEDLSGRAIRGYSLGERIGNGGFGAVYRAMQPLVEREVAVKIILPKYANHPEFIRRFEAEAQLVARLEHPHIVPLYDYWREPNVAYLVMRLLRGGSVQNLLQNGPLQPDVALRIIEQIGSALGVAHRAGVIHRDLKPANILLDEEHNAYLADFGIAKNLSSPLPAETQMDAIIGSPDYISPEQIRSEFVRPQTDIYCLGVMIYELLTGSVPFHGPTPIEVMHQHLTVSLPPLAAVRAGLPKALDEVIEHATAKDPFSRYENVESLVADFRRALGADWYAPAAEITTPEARPTAILTAADNPYKGLRAFNEFDAEDFFGREALIQQLLVRLGEGGDLARFLAIVGPSGSGKSSVVKAGLIPALRRGGLPGSENWFIVEMLPGPNPLEELEAALLRVAVNPPSTLIEQLHTDKRGLLRAVNRCLPNDPAVELVLVIDQFEEVFTLVEDEAVRAHLLDSLVTAALDERSRVRMIVTLRADFVDRPLNYVDLGELMRQRNEFVLPLTPDELERAITGPAERVGLRLDPGLMTTIVRDIGDQPGTLPLLQYALTELFEKREGDRVTRAAYQVIGGVLGALGKRAETVFAALDESSQGIARQLFLRMVTLGEGVEDTRRRVLRAELEALGNAAAEHKAIASVLEAFGRSRLFTFDRDPVTRGATVEVAHEALLREWPRLREWLNDNRADVRLQRQLALAAKEWEEAQRDASFLLTGTHLAQYEDWTGTAQVTLTPDERAYLQMSVAERQRLEAEEVTRQQRELEAARKLAETERDAALVLRNRNRVISAVSVIAFVLAILAGVLALFSKQNATLADEQRNAALNAQATAQAQAELSATQRTIAENDRLAAEAYLIASNPSGNSELAALLSIRSLRNRYTANADAALTNAMLNLHTRFIIHPENPAAPGGAAFSPDGSAIAIGSLSHTIQLWDAETGEFIRTVSTGAAGPTSNFWFVKYSHDGKWLLAADSYGTSQIISVETGEYLQYYDTGFYGTLEPDLSPDGKTAFTAVGNTIQIWDTTSGKRQILIALPGTVYTANFAPDGRSIIAGLTNGEAYLLDATSGEQLQIFNKTVDGRVAGVTISPDGQYAAIGQYSGAIYIYRVETAELINTFKSHQDEILSLAFSPDGKLLISSSWDTTVRLWDVATGEQLNVFAGHTRAIMRVAFSPDGQSALSSSSDGTVRVWRIPENILNLQNPHERFLPHTWAELSPQNNVLLLASWSDQETKLRFIDTLSYKLLYSTDTPPSAFSLSPDGNYFFVCFAEGGKFVSQIWDIHTGKLIAKLNNENGVNYGVFSPNSSFLFTLDASGDSIWDVKSGQRISILRTGAMEFATWSSDEKYIAIGADDGFTHIFDVQRQYEIKTLGSSSNSIDAEWITAVAFLPANKNILTGDASGIIRMWDIESGKILREFNGHTSEVWSIAPSPDGKFILSASNDKTVRLWDIESGAPIRTFNHTQYVNYAGFSPDGEFIVSSGGDGARLWDTDYHDTIAAACSLLIRDFTPEERAQYGIIDTAPTCPAKP